MTLVLPCMMHQYHYNKCFTLLNNQNIYLGQPVWNLRLTILTKPLNYLIYWQVLLNDPRVKIEHASFILVGGSQHSSIHGKGAVVMNQVLFSISCCHSIHILVQIALYLDTYSIASQQHLNIWSDINYNLKIMKDIEICWAN